MNFNSFDLLPFDPQNDSLTLDDDDDDEKNKNARLRIGSIQLFSCTCRFNMFFFPMERWYSSKTTAANRSIKDHK